MHAGDEVITDSIQIFEYTIFIECNYFYFGDVILSQINDLLLCVWENSRSEWTAWFNIKWNTSSLQDVLTPFRRNLDLCMN